MRKSHPRRTTTAPSSRPPVRPRFARRRPRGIAGKACARRRVRAPPTRLSQNALSRSTRKSQAPPIPPTPLKRPPRRPLATEVFTVFDARACAVQMCPEMACLLASTGGRWFIFPQCQSLHRDAPRHHCCSCKRHPQRRVKRKTSPRPKRAASSVVWLAARRYALCAPRLVQSRADSLD